MVLMGNPKSPALTPHTGRPPSPTVSQGISCLHGQSRQLPRIWGPNHGTDKAQDAGPKLEEYPHCSVITFILRKQKKKGNLENFEKEK